MITRANVPGAIPRVARRQRTPQHTFHVKHAPFVIQPFMLAPVLPGETLLNASLQSRALTKNIKSQLIGWWLEHYLFYVPLRAIDEQAEVDTIQRMLIAGESLSTSGFWRTSTSDDQLGSHSNYTGMDWVQASIRSVIQAFFRHKEDAFNAALIDGAPAAYVNQTNALESAILEADMDTAMDETIETTETEGTPNIVTVSARDIDAALQQYQLNYAQGLIEVSFEDWLRTYGVRVAQPVVPRPELIRYSRDWQYPSTAVVPDTVTAGDSDITSAVSWVVAERADKRRYFREPGFILGVTCCRPKVYWTNLRRPVASLLDNAMAWMPAVLRQDVMASWRKNTDGAEDLIGGVATGDWWLDLKDLFLHGDQFIAGEGVDPDTDTTMNMMALPAADLNGYHPIQAGVDGLFVDGDATGGVKQDGIVRLTIAGNLEETSPVGARAVIP